MNKEEQKKVVESLMLLAKDYISEGQRKSSREPLGNVAILIDIAGGLNYFPKEYLESLKRSLEYFDCAIYLAQEHKKGLENQVQEQKKRR